MFLKKDCVYVKSLNEDRERTYNLLSQEDRPMNSC